MSYKLFKDRLQLILNLAGINQTQFANYFKIEPSYVSKLLSGTNKRIGRAFALRISEKFKIDFIWLYEGKGKPPERVVLPNADPTEPSLVEVSILNWGGAEQGYDVFEQIPESEQAPLKTIKLPEELVNNWRQGIEVKGDSMAPTLKDGDYVGVDRNDKNIESGELYLIRSKYVGLIVKRLEDATPDGIMLKSDNPMHTSRIVEHDKIEHDVEIMGRIAWIFGTRKRHQKR